MILINEHLEFGFNLFMIWIDVIVIGEFFDRFCELCIYFDQFLQGLFQHSIFLIKLTNLLPELFVLTLTCKVVLETVGHDLIKNKLKVNISRNQNKKT